MKKLSVVFVGIASLITSVPSFADTKEIQVVAVVGTAKAGGRNLRAGDHIRVNEVIETDENSGCKIRLGDRTVIDIAASSVFRVESVRGGAKDETVTHLDNGAAKASVPSNSAVKASVVKSLNQKPKFYMKTKWSVIAVRGTKFFVMTTDEQKSVGVYEGDVEARGPNGDQVLKNIPAGRMIKVGNPLNPATWDMLPLTVQTLQKAFGSSDEGGLIQAASEAPDTDALAHNRSPSSVDGTGFNAAGAAFSNRTSVTAVVNDTAASNRSAALVQITLVP